VDALRAPNGTVILIGFDVDGTLDTSAGPVPWERVKALHLFLQLTKAGACGIVSPSSAWPREVVPAYLPGPTRADNLRAFAAAYPLALVRLYVSNNDDIGEAAAAGFAYVDYREFAAAVRGR
jgi:hypothetical protein